MKFFDSILTFNHSRALIKSFLFVIIEFTEVSIRLKNDLCNVTLLSNRIRYNLNNHPWISLTMVNLINSYNLFREGTWANSKELSRTTRDFMNSVYEIQNYNFQLYNIVLSLKIVLFIGCIFFYCDWQRRLMINNIRTSQFSWA